MIYETLILGGSIIVCVFLIGRNSRSIGDLEYEIHKLKSKKED